MQAAVQMPSLADQRSLPAHDHACEQSWGMHLTRVAIIPAHAPAIILSVTDSFLLSLAILRLMKS